MVPPSLPLSRPLPWGTAREEDTSVLALGARACDKGRLCGDFVVNCIRTYVRALSCTSAYAHARAREQTHVVFNININLTLDRDILI